MNGHANCILAVCCPPAARPQALADAIIEANTHTLLPHVSGGDPEELKALCAKIATWIYEHADLVPKGIGTAIVEGYRPVFEGDFAEKHPSAHPTP